MELAAHKLAVQQLGQSNASLLVALNNANLIVAERDKTIAELNAQIDKLNTRLADQADDLLASVVKDGL